MTASYFSSIKIYLSLEAYNICPWNTILNQEGFEYFSGFKAFYNFRMHLQGTEEK